MLQLGRLMGPRILILGMFQFVFLLTTNLASRLEEGSIAAINIGWIVMQMPEVIFGMAIATAAFPTLARLAAQGERGKLQDAVSGALRAILLTTLPSTVALLLLGRPYIALLFRSGAFDQRAVDMVYGATVAFTAGLLGHSLLELAARLFYAHKNTLTPFWVALGATALNLALCLALAPPLGHAGLALANSIAVTLQSGLLLWLGRRTLVAYPWRPIGTLAWKATLASIAMAGSILLVTGRQASLGSLRTALLGSAAGGATYLALVALLNAQEMRRLAGLLRSRLGR
jgi:putative peptidoglycan lipid II flippase